MADLPSVHSMSIHHGPSIGGTDLKIQLQGAVDVHKGVLVKFTDCFRETSQIVEGKIAQGCVTCKTPAWQLLSPTVAVIVQVSVDGGNSFSVNTNDVSPHLRFWAKSAISHVTKSTDINFHYYMPPRVSSMQPSSGLSAGGMLVTITGHHLKNHGAPVMVAFSNR